MVLQLRVLSLHDGGEGGEVFLNLITHKSLFWFGSLL
jgi:hypothetical protein